MINTTEPNFSMMATVAPLDALDLHRRDGFPTIQVLMVTPQVAQAWLDKYHGRNRPLQASKVKAYAESMQNGRWEATHQGVSISREGTLIDGQHRLRAVVKSNATVPMTVAVGFPHHTFSLVDNGKIRTLADVLSIWLKDDPDLEALAVRSKRISTIVRVLKNHDEGRYQTVPNSEIANQDFLDILESGTYDLEALGESVTQSMPVKKIASEATVGAFFYLVSHRSGVEGSFVSKAFLAPLTTGAPFTSGRDPRLVLRNRRIREQSLGQISWTHKSRQETLAMMIHAWNLFIQEKEVSSMRIPKEMPSVRQPSDAFVLRYADRHF